MEGGDAFGGALLDVLAGGVGRHAIERDDGRIDWMDATEYFSTPEAWPRELVDGLSRLQGRALDVGCGAGRHALYLASRGCDVSASTPRLARSRSASPWVRRDPRSARGREPRADRFDSIAMLGNNFGLLASPEQAPAHLRWLADRCAPAATLVGDAQDPTHTDNPDHLAYHQRQTAKGRPPGEARLRVMFDGQVDDWFSYWYLTPDELRDAVSQTPWQLASVAGSPIYTAILTLASAPPLEAADPCPRYHYYSHRNDRPRRGAPRRRSPLPHRLGGQRERQRPRSDPCRRLSESHR